MSTPQSGFRRAAVTSWALAGIGAAGVAGASALAYAGTYRPPAPEPPTALVEPAPPEVVAPPLPQAPSTTDAPPPAAPQPTVEPTVPQAPIQTHTPTYVPRSTPTYVPEPTAQQQAPEPAPAPVTKSQSAFPIRKSHIPTGGSLSGGNNFSPHVTIARGS